MFSVHHSELARRPGCRPGLLRYLPVVTPQGTAKFTTTKPFDLSGTVCAKL